MGTFTVAVEVVNLYDRAKSVELPDLLVDTGSKYTWVPRETLEALGIAVEKEDLEFVMADGSEVTRSIGFCILKYDKHFTVDEVVFAEEGDLLLGARTLEGLNLVVDPGRKKLVAAGPLPAAATASPTPSSRHRSSAFPPEPEFARSNG